MIDLAEQTPPIIVIGMHRSGTSMITDVLESLGLFMGMKLNEMHEARFFLNINRRILRESGGSWMHPEAIDKLANDPQARQHVTGYLRFLMSAPRAVSYLGWQRFLRLRPLAPVWGWKDPQNTYTLPFWLDIFPEARVIHIYRNGVDVASSLWVRSQKNVQKLDQWRGRSWSHQVKRGIFPHSESGYITLQNGFELWEQYTCAADKQVASLPPERVREIRYETFLQNPLPILQELCGFVGLATDPAQLAAVVAKLDPARGNAYAHDDHLMRFYQQVKGSPQMIKYGYSDGA